MPEPGQGTLSGQLTALIEAVLRAWSGPAPRLVYITDGGTHQAGYYRRVLRRMNDPHHPGRRLEWRWVIDYYHACEYITKLSEALFSEAREGASWARKMRRWLKEKPRGIYRVLHSAAALRRRRIIVSAAKREQYRTAYAYLRKRMRWLDYRGYRRDHLPIGSGVTEAACKTVFTQRMKQSGMTWKAESGQWIVDLRVIHLSGVWSEVYQSYLGSKDDARDGDSRDYTEGKGLKGRIIAGTGAIAPDLPEPDRLIRARRDDRFTVRGEGNGCDGAAMQQHGKQRLAGLGLPEAERLVLAPGGDDLSVRAECHGIHVVLMHERFADRLVRGHIPALRDVDIDTGYDRVAVRGKSHGRAPRLDAQEGRQWACRYRPPIGGLFGPCFRSG